MTPQDLIDLGLDGFLATSVLSLLDEGPLQALLAEAEFVWLVPGQVLVEAGARPAGVWLIAEGLVEESEPQPGGALVQVGRLGHGRLVGHRGLVRGHTSQPRARVLCPTTALFVEGDAFAELRRGHPDLARASDSILETGDQTEGLLDLMMGSPLLRGLGRDELLRLMDSGVVVKRARGVDLMTRGAPAADVYVLLAGRVGVHFTDDADAATEGRQPIELVPPAVVGHRAVLAGTSRGHTVRTRGVCRLLRIPAEAFRAVVDGNQSARRVIVEDAAGRSSAPADPSLAAPVVLTVYGDARGRGSTTVAYGLAGCLATEIVGVVRVFDLRLHDHAARWGLPLTTARVGGRLVTRLSAPEAWNLDVLGPAEDVEAPPRLDAVAAGARCLIVVADAQARGQGGLARDSDGVVFVSCSPAETFAVASPPGQFRVDAVRLRLDPDASQGRVRHLVRVPEDAESAAAFVQRADLGPITDEATGLGGDLSAPRARLSGTHRGARAGGRKVPGGTPTWASCGPWRRPESPWTTSPAVPLGRWSEGSTPLRGCRGSIASSVGARSCCCRRSDRSTRRTEFVTR